jgi:hypothetical protein
MGGGRRRRVWVIEARSSYNGRSYHVAMIVKFRDGKTWRDTRYYAEPFEAPAWRGQWSSRWSTRL